MIKFKNLRLICLDNDDVLFNSSPLIQFHVERNWPQFATRILKTRERNISILQYQYDLTEAEIKKARELGVIPNLPNFNTNRNDVIRGLEERKADFEDEFYRRPLLEIGEALELVKFDKEMFFNRFTSYYNEYDYIVGDIAYSKLRLKGFNKKSNKNHNKINSYDNLEKYLKENCAYDCRYFILEKIKE